MSNLHIDSVRGERCVLVLVSDGTTIKQYEYEQDSALDMSCRDAIFKFINGDENTRLEDSDE